jgi:hypothetical protein
VRQYATVEELAGFLAPDELPDNADKLLGYATLLVRDACRRDLYKAQPDGLPADDDLREAMVEAVLMQAAEWDAAGINPAAGSAGQGAEVASSSLGGGSVTFDAAGQRQAKAAAVSALSAAALFRLRDAGLASSGVLGW